MIYIVRILLLYFILFFQFLFGDSFDEVLNKLEGGKILSDPNLQLRDDIINLGRSTRHSFNNRDIRFDEDRIIIEANCRRTNIQSTIVKTFWLCGYTLSRSSIYFPKVIVILNVSKRDGILIISASGLDVVELGSRKISDYELNKAFLNKIHVYTQNSK